MKMQKSWIVALGLYALLAAPPLLGDEVPRVLITPTEDRTEADGYEALAATVTDTVRVTLPLLGDYDVRMYDGERAVPNREAARELAADEAVDNVVFGWVRLTAEGRPVVELSVYDRPADRVAVSATEEAPSLLDVFDAADVVLAEIMEGFTGERVAFGALELRPEPAAELDLMPDPEEPVFEARLDGEPLEEGEHDFDLIPAGERELAVYRGGVSGRQEIARQEVVLEEGETATVSFEVPAAVDEDRRLYEEARERLNTACAQPAAPERAEKAKATLNDLLSFYGEAAATALPGLPAYAELGPARTGIARAMARIEELADAQAGPEPAVRTPEEIVSLARELRETALEGLGELDAVGAEALGGFEKSAADEEPVASGDAGQSGNEPPGGTSTDPADAGARAVAEALRNVQAADALLRLELAGLLEEHYYEEALEVAGVWIGLRGECAEWAESGVAGGAEADGIPAAADPVGVVERMSGEEAEELVAEIERLVTLEEESRPAHHLVAGGLGAASLAGGAAIALGPARSAAERAEEAYEEYQAYDDPDDREALVAAREEAEEYRDTANRLRIAQWGAVGAGAAALTYAAVARWQSRRAPRRQRGEILEERLALERAVTRERTETRGTLVVAADGAAHYDGDRVAGELHFVSRGSTITLRDAQPVGAPVEEYELDGGEAAPAVVVVWPGKSG